MLSRLLNKVLAGIVEDFVPNEVELGLRGSITLWNVRVKPSFLQGMKLPVNVRSAVVGRLALQVTTPSIAK